MLIMSASVCTSDDANCKDDIQALWVSGTAAGIVFLGSITGMLSMGYIGDIIGRNAAIVITLSLTALGALTSAVCSIGSPEQIYAIIIGCRFILGVGAGGVYPLSAAKAGEDACASSSGEGEGVNVVASSSAFFFQCPGALTPWLLGYILSYSSISVEAKWRLILGLGAVPAFFVVLLTLYEIHLRRAETPAEAKSEVSTKPVISAADETKFRWMLLLAGSCWFIYDVSFYGVSLFGGVIINDMKSADDDNVSSDRGYRYATGYQLLANIAGIPAGIATIYLMKYLGTRRVQMSSFLFQGSMFFLMACTFYPLKDSGQDVSLFVIYFFLVFSLTSGSSMTTFCVPTELFPFEVRTTYIGMAAACGKMGAFIGSYMVSLNIIA